MEEMKAMEARELAKGRFPYTIFMYEAEHVGISATGDEDTNELGPHTVLPDGVERSCLDWYQLYQNDPAALSQEHLQ